MRPPPWVPGILLLGLATSAATQEPTVTDAHLHYSRNAWSVHSPEAILGILDGAGVRRAFVSSTPDEGTLQLHRLAPDRIVPVLRPYRQEGDLGRWYTDATVVTLLEERLTQGVHRGISEFHLSGADAQAPVVRQVMDLAARHRLFVHCHCDAEAIEILLGLRNDVPVLWAHAGMSADPATVGRLLDAWGRLSVELALRSDVAPGGRLDPAWEAPFLRHPTRFMVGTDTWIPSRWNDLAAVQAATRAWLRQLPPEVARALASDNAERLAAAH